MQGSRKSFETMCTRHMVVGAGAALFVIVETIVKVVIVEAIASLFRRHA